MKALLFLSLGPFYYPEEIPVRAKYRMLSDRYRGDILAVVNEPKFRKAELENFRLHGLYLPRRIRHSKIWRDVIYVAFALLKGVMLHYTKNKYSVIIAPEPLVGGMLALALSKLTGAKSIVEVNGNFESAFRLDSEKSGFKNRFKQQYAKIIIPFVLHHSDGVKLLYPDQIKSFLRTSGSEIRHKCIFADFVPIGLFQQGEGHPGSILFIGYPWHLKGVDVLIKAFKAMCSKHAGLQLKIVGFCADKAPWIKLIGSNDKIQLCNPVWYPDVIKLMSECSLFVLPSRTEAMGRVLLEAMASRKPVIGSNVDGIPNIIRHGETGLLFESENVDDLLSKMEAILFNPDYAKKLAENGYRYVHEELSEARYFEHFNDMIERVTG